MFEEELKLLLEKKWEEEQRELINKLMSNLTYYNKLLPKSLRKDITDALQMCNVLKMELEKYRELCKCQLKCNCNKFYSNCNEPNCVKVNCNENNKCENEQ